MPTAILARLVLLEARRGGLPWLAAGCILLALTLGAFLSQVALTESVALQTAVVAALLRACAVFLVAAQVASSVLREISDKGLEQMLSLPLSRTAHYLGRLAGFSACGIALSAAFSLALLPWAAPGAIALWGLSLALETVLVAAAALFFAMALAQLVPAIAATLGFYLLARSMGAIQAIAAGPAVDAGFAAQAARATLDGIALVLPPLDSVTRTEWLLYAPPAAGAFVAGLGVLALYIALLAAAGLFDFHRRNW